MKSIYFLIIALFLTLTSFSQQQEIDYSIKNFHRYYNDGQKVKDVEKEKYIEQYRSYYHDNGTKAHFKNHIKSAKEILEQLNEDGKFKDLIQIEQKLIADNTFNIAHPSTTNPASDFFIDSFGRIRKVAELYGKGEVALTDEQKNRIYKSIVHYGTIEIGRKNVFSRFHASCFAIPSCAVDIYFSMLNEMNASESGKDKNAELTAACDMLKILGLQAWTQPYRNDTTDNNVVTIERFRNHIWWVGGNALGYRPLLQAAIMYKSIPMVDLLSEICQKAMSTASQSTYNSAFWNEGFTTDGGGWGHGKQNLIWGYPIDGTSGALKVLSLLKGSPWAKQLSKENAAAILNYLRGSSWYYHKGYTISGISRNDMKYNLETKAIPSSQMLKTLISDWSNSFSPAELIELKQLTKEAENNSITMNSAKEGIYSGTRWFFNNDDLIKKNDKYHIFLNMASERCDGLESAPLMADAYNFFTADGSTMFLRNGLEYRTVFGAWDVTATPGITAREGMDKITPVTNWRGYCSKFNFAGAATHGGANAVAGFVFEKMNGSDKENVADRGTATGKNPSIYGVKAHKSYFILGDYLVALGAGITNLQAQLEGVVRTTIDQTAKTDEVFVINKGVKKQIENGVQTFMQNGKPVWVMQKGKFAYTILPEYSNNAYFVFETKKTNWGKMNNENKGKSGLSESVDMLKLWVDHGQKVKDGTYGYVVYCGSDKPKSTMPFKVLQNNTLIQAIQSTDGKITEVVFYSKETELKAKNMKVSASVPCVVLIELNGNEKTLTVNDPQMDADLKQIKLLLNGRSIIVDMPQGEFCGKPITVKL